MFFAKLFPVAQLLLADNNSVGLVTSPRIYVGQLGGGRPKTQPTPILFTYLLRSKAAVFYFFRYARQVGPYQKGEEQNTAGQARYLLVVEGRAAIGS